MPRSSGRPSAAAGRVSSPQCSGHSPPSTRTSDDFPAADAPVTINGLSGVTLRLRPCATFSPRGVTISPPSKRTSGSAVPTTCPCAVDAAKSSSISCAHNDTAEVA